MPKLSSYTFYQYYWLLFVSYWLLVLAYIVLYRISPLHPLAKFPGPFFYRITKFNNARLVSRGFYHFARRRLFEKVEINDSFVNLLQRISKAQKIMTWTRPQRDLPSVSKSRNT